MGCYCDFFGHRLKSEIFRPSGRLASQTEAECESIESSSYQQLWTVAEKEPVRGIPARLTLCANERGKLSDTHFHMGSLRGPSVAKAT
jgi:hypothetical protein